MAKMKELQSFLTEVSIVEVGFTGNPFTWNNRRFNGVLVKERIDRVIVNLNWLHKFPNALVNHETFRGSDHYPIILNFGMQQRRRDPPLCYEVGWNDQAECQEIIAKCWNQFIAGSLMYQIVSKLKKCREEILKWRRDARVNNRRIIDQINDKLRTVQAANIEGELWQQ